MHISQKKMENEFRKNEKDIFIAAITGIFISIISFLLFGYVSCWIIVFTQLRFGVEPMEFSSAFVLYIFIFIFLMFAAKFYKTKEYRNLEKESEFYHMLLGFAIIIPNFVNYNIQCIFDFLLLKSRQYSLGLAMDILKLAKPGAKLKDVYDVIKNYSEQQIRLTLLMLEKSEYIFINKKKWLCYTTDKGDNILYEWSQKF